MSIRITAMNQDQRLKFLQIQKDTLSLSTEQNPDMTQFYEGNAEDFGLNPTILNILLARQENLQHSLFDEFKTYQDYSTEPKLTQLHEDEFLEMLSRVNHVSVSMKTYRKFRTVLDFLLKQTLLAKSVTYKNVGSVSGYQLKT